MLCLMHPPAEGREAAYMVRLPSRRGCPLCPDCAAHWRTLTGIDPELFIESIRVNNVLTQHT